MASSSYFNIHVTHVVEAIALVENPSFCNLTFWGQKSKPLASKLEKQYIQQCSFDTCFIPSPCDFKKGKIICVLLNSNWVRAEVIDVTSDAHGQYIDVNCIDYGLTQSIPLNFTRLIPQSARVIADLNSFPPLASKFMLADVLIDKTPVGKESALMFLKQHVENKDVKAVSLGNHHGTEGVRVYLNDQLVAKLLVDSHKGVPASTYYEALNAPIPTNHAFLADHVTPLELQTTVNNIPWRSSHSSCSNHSLLNGASSKETESPSAFLNAAIIARPTIRYTASYLESNVTHNITVTEIHNGPAKFVIKCKSPDADKRLALISQQLLVYTNQNSNPLLKPAKGDPCIAVSCRDKLFHRGLVTLIDDDKYSRVYFVDQGFTELVPNKLMFEIPAELVAKDLLSMRVELHEAGYLLVHDGVAQIFTSLVLNKSFQCKVVGLSTTQSVTLFDHAGRNVKDLVIEALSHGIRSSLTLNIPIISAPASPNPALIRVNLKVNIFLSYLGYDN